MSSITSLAGDLGPRLRALQPVIWIQTDEPSRCAEWLRQFVVSVLPSATAKANGANGTKPDAAVFNVFEHDISNGAYKIWDSKAQWIKGRPTTPGAPVRDGEPVDWCNRDAASNGNLPSTLKANNFRPAEPWVFLYDILQNMPARSFMICHNFAEVIDTALRAPHPHGRGMIRDAMLQLTGKMGVATLHKALSANSRVLIATGRLPAEELARPEILDTFDVLHLDRPNEEELAKLIEECLGKVKSEEKLKGIRDASMRIYRTESFDSVPRLAAKNLKGLSTFSAESAVFRVATCEPGALDPGELTKQRRSIITRSPALELLDPDPLFTLERVHGVENVIEWAKGSLHPGIPPALRPNGAILVGPGGTGKSMLSRALGHHQNVPFVRFDIGRIFGSLVGESQARARAAMDTIDAIGDCVCLIDEADKHFAGLISDGGSRGDSGTGSQVMGAMLTWMQERRGQSARAFIILACNRIKNLKTELIRRFDATFFVDLPAAPARRAILEQYLKDYESTLTSDQIEDVVRRTRYWSGDELRRLTANFARFKDLDKSFKFVKTIWDQDRNDVSNLRKEASAAGHAASALSVDNEDELLLSNGAEIGRAVLN